MQKWFWKCETCGNAIPVESTETNQYRNITCDACGKTYSVLNSELSATESFNEKMP